MVRRLVGIVFAALSLYTAAHAQSSCTATNDNQDQTCTADCPSGQTATCMKGTGSQSPTCQCSGTPIDERSLKGRMSLVGAKSRAIRLVPLDGAASAPSPIVNTDLIQVINAKLLTSGPKHVSDSCQIQYDTCYTPVQCVHDGVCSGGHAFQCHGRNVCTPVMGAVTLSNGVDVVTGPQVVLGTPPLNSIPSEAFTVVGEYSNCSQVTQGYTLHHSETLQMGETVQNSNTLTTGQTLTTTVNGSVSLGGVTLGGMTQFSVNESDSIGNQTLQSSLQSTTESADYPINVPLMTYAHAVSTFILYHVPVPFTGTIVVDGSVSANLAGINKISDVFPNVADRTFQFSGVVTDSTLIDSKTSVATKTLTPTSPECTSNPGSTAQTVMHIQP